MKAFQNKNRIPGIITLNVLEYITDTYGGEYRQGQLKIHEDYNIFPGIDSGLWIIDNVTNVVHKFFKEYYIGTEDISEEIIKATKSKASKASKSYSSSQTRKTKEK